MWRKVRVPAPGGASPSIARSVFVSLYVGIALLIGLSGCQPAASSPGRVVYPESGKTITVIVPFAAGGATDRVARLVTAALEKELGVPLQVVNKPEAGGQGGTSEIARAKPDGYTIGFTNLPTTISISLDPERKAGISRQSFQPIAQLVDNPVAASVRTDSPFKTLQDLMGTAKANPGKVKVGTSGILAAPHLVLLDVAKAGGVEFATVNFDGSGPTTTALLGGHVDAVFHQAADALGPLRAGQIRVLGISGRDESSLLPGVKTFASQGYPSDVVVLFALSAPAGTPQEVVGVLGQAVKKVLDDHELRSKLQEAGYGIRYADAAEFSATWERMETQVKTLIEEYRAKQR